MVRASSGADISPRSSTSLPTIDRLDHVGKLLGERDPGLDLLAGQVGQARQPQALHDLQAVALGDLRNLVEPVVGRIGADAIGELLELGEVFLDLPGLDRYPGPNGFWSPRNGA